MLSSEPLGQEGLRTHTEPSTCLPPLRGQARLEFHRGSLAELLHLGRI